MKLSYRNAVRIQPDVWVEWLFLEILRVSDKKRSKLTNKISDVIAIDFVRSMDTIVMHHMVHFICQFEISSMF